MDITPKHNVTINGLQYQAGETYVVNYTTFTKMIAAGCMQSFTEPIATADMAVKIETSEPEPKPEPKQTARRSRRSKTIQTK